MRKQFFVFMVLIIFSCSKEPAKPTMNFSLLKQYNWQRINQYAQKFPLDTSQIIQYADTSTYSFEEKSFTYKGQSTNIYFVFGSGQPRYTLQKKYSVIQGHYEFAAADSTLNVTYTTKIGGNPGWGVPAKDTTIHSRFKIVELNSQILKIKGEPYSPNSIPFPDSIQSYSAVKK